MLRSFKKSHPQIHPSCLIGAGALVSEGMKVPPRSLVLGVPGRVKRALRRDELLRLHQRPKDYIRYARKHVQGSSRYL